MSVWDIFRKLFTDNSESESDFGRKFGWDVVYQGNKVADLIYIKWEEASQFWHSYKIEWENEESVLSFPLDSWSEEGVMLRNKRHQNVEVKDYLSSGDRKDNIIFLRYVRV